MVAPLKRQHDGTFRLPSYTPALESEYAKIVTNGLVLTPEDAQDLANIDVVDRRQRHVQKSYDKRNLSRSLILEMVVDSMQQELLAQSPIGDWTLHTLIIEESMDKIHEGVLENIFILYNPPFQQILTSTAIFPHGSTSAHLSRFLSAHM